MPYKPGKKRIEVGTTHGFIGDVPSKKSPAKKEPYDAVYERGYWLLRDRIIYADIFTDEETKQAILERYKK